MCGVDGSPSFFDYTTTHLEKSVIFHDFFQGPSKTAPNSTGAKMVSLYSRGFRLQPSQLSNFQKTVKNASLSKIVVFVRKMWSRLHLCNFSFWLIFIYWCDEKKNTFGDFFGITSFMTVRKFR